MKINQEELSRTTYSRFRRDHDGLREDLLARLPDASEGGNAIRRGRFTPASMRWAAGLAASAALALVVGFLLPRSATPAYAFEDLPFRLAECRSILVEGWHSPSDGVRIPQRLYVEKPNVYWFTTSATRDGRVSFGTVASDGKRWIRVDDGERTVMTGKEIPLAAELMAQQLLQMSLSGQQVGLNQDGYKKTGVEQLRGLPVDVYQLRGRDTRRVVWVDRAIGMPIQIAVYMNDKGVERRFLSLEIRPNVARPAAFPSFESPEGYATTRLDRTPDALLGIGSGSAGGESLDIRLALRIDDNAFLVCWRRFSRKEGATLEPDLEGPVGRPDTLRITSLDGKRPYKAYRLKNDPWEDGLHARWSLVVPEDAQAGVGEVCASLETAGNRMSFEFSPLRFKDERLAQIIEEVQRLTLPKAAAQDGILTLRQLQKLARAVRHER